VELRCLWLNGGMSSLYQRTTPMTERQMHLSGWILFTLSAVFYILSSLESQSLTSLIGSVLFLLACLFFIIPYFWGGDEG
jgi:predicted membrane channel-forming protein YqfA (hemolysin III family)